MNKNVFTTLTLEEELKMIAKEDMWMVGKHRRVYFNKSSRSLQTSDKKQKMFVNYCQLKWVELDHSSAHAITEGNQRKETRQRPHRKKHLIIPQKLLLGPGKNGLLRRVWNRA